MKTSIRHIFKIILITQICFGQQNYSILKTEQPCVVGSATLILNDTALNKISWSNGIVGKVSGMLASGANSVEIKFTFKSSPDTVIYFDMDVPPCSIMPNTYFSPNDDGYNDAWQISRLEYYPNFALYVYDRNGQLVFKQEDKYSGWDGLGIVGLPVEDSTYFYVLYPDKQDKKKVITGKVAVIR